MGGTPFIRPDDWWDAQPLGQMSDADIARELGCNRRLVTAQRNRRGIPPYPKGQSRDSVRDDFAPETVPSYRHSSTTPAPAPRHAMRPPAPSSADREHRILFVPDTHAPYHDRRAWKCMLAAAQVWKPTCLVILGDFLDMYCVSRYAKKPERKLRLDDEICGGRDALDELDALGVRWKYYVMGNHEARLGDHIVRHTPQFDGLLSVEELLSLERRGWEPTPYGRGRQIGELWVTHDLDVAGKYAVRRSIEHAWSSIIIGHTHRLEIVHLADGRGRPCVGASFGWLGDFEAVDYAKRKIVTRQWRHGFGIAYMDAEGRADVRAVPIDHGRCRIEGQVVTADDYAVGAAA